MTNGLKILGRNHKQILRILHNMNKDLLILGIEKKCKQRLRKSGELPDKLSLQDEVRRLDADYRTSNGKLRRMMNQAGYDPRSEKVVPLKKLVKIKQNRKQARINLDSIDRGFLGNRRMRDSFFPRIWNVEYVKQNEKLLQKNLEGIFATIQNLLSMIQMKWYIPQLDYLLEKLILKQESECNRCYCK